ncbi:MAG: PAS domain-containing sensor histidine kinase [Gammaproteobacteria bacterium]|nr:PAS domain-containing sensor histidine kinase [Gammaproteobacteria bacterium]|tara:strand:- start:391 stop:1737 length:1347 start_codon:yes stop_codon:yes gene_type:complete
MGYRFRIFLIVFISMGIGILFSNIISSNSDISLLVVTLSLFIVATIASLLFINFSYQNISNLEALASKIADGRTKKRYIKALKEDSGEFGNVALSISKISENLKDKINQIAKQRDQFGSVLDDLGEGIVVTDQDGDITFENDQFSQILNLKNVSGQNIKDLGIKSLGYLFRRSKKRKRADIEFEIELNDNSNRWVLATINQSKTTKEYILVVHDITQLRSLDSMRRDFISNLSHELRTPVSVIRANSETLIDSALDDKKQAKIFAKAILHNAERLTDMVSSLLDLSRIEYGELKLNFEQLDLDLFFKRYIESISTLSKKKNINILFNPQHQGAINADFQAFERIMNNLVDNAIKYSEKDSQIIISTSNESDEYIKIMVEDSGEGISSEDKDHIFSRFYRTASARATDNQGSGLGLAIVKHLVNSLNGEVGVQNSESKGSIFWFTVPIS